MSITYPTAEIPSWSGSPEGVHEGFPGMLCVDSDTGTLYRKGPGTATTGWVAIGGGGGAHTHPQSDVTGLVAALAALAPLVHGHAQSEVSGLVAALAAKADSGHTHAALMPGGGSTGQVLAKTSGADFACGWSTPSGGSNPFTTFVLAADVSTGANVTPVNVTGLVFPFSPATRYLVEVFGSVQAPAATTGIGLHLDTSAAVTLVTMTFFHQLANTGTLTGGSSRADDTSAGVSSGLPAAATPTPFYACGTLIAAAGPGTAQLRLRSEVAAVSTIKANTIMRVMSA